MAEWTNLSDKVIYPKRHIDSDAMINLKRVRDQECHMVHIFKFYYEINKFL